MEVAARLMNWFYFEKRHGYSWKFLPSRDCFGVGRLKQVSALLSSLDYLPSSQVSENPPAIYEIPILRA